jgi:hypothetical protein
MNKIIKFFLIAAFSIFVAVVYGILHDQTTYHISKEFYILFKFEESGLNEWGDIAEHLKVAIVGFLATWWIGLIFGLVYASVSLFFNYKKIVAVTIQSVLLNISITALFSCLGFIWGVLFLSDEIENGYIPQETIDIESFAIACSIHEFSYIGGGIGLIFGVYYQIKKSLRSNLTAEEINQSQAKY